MILEDLAEIQQDLLFSWKTELGKSVACGAEAPLHRFLSKHVHDR
jgi:hypothetical protein